jgi:hypothetical protein
LVVVTFSAKANPAVVEVIQLAGNATLNPVAQSATAANASGDATASLTTPDAANGEVVLVSFLKNVAPTTPAGFTALDTFHTDANGGESLGVYFASSAQASTTATAPAGGHGWGTVALELAHG